MNPAAVKDLQKYLKPGSGWKAAAIVMLVLSVIYLLPLPVLTVTCLVIGALCFWRYTAVRKKFSRTLESEGGAAGEEQVLRDFAAAQSLFNDSLRVGREYLFTKGSGRLLRYSQIRQVYQHIQRTNFIETSRTLRYVNTDGKTRILCNLPLRDKGKEQVLQLMAFLLSKNPNIKLGYK